MLDARLWRGVVVLGLDRFVQHGDVIVCRQDHVLLAGGINIYIDRTIDTIDYTKI